MLLSFVFVPVQSYYYTDSVFHARSNQHRMTPPVTLKNRARTVAQITAAAGVVAVLVAGAFVRPAAPAVAAPTPAVAGPSVRPSPARPPAAPAAAAAVSFKAGMSYAQVIAVLGRAGEEVVSSNLCGVTTVLYEWKDNTAWATKNAVFEDGKLVRMNLFAGK